jgi:hypothetical protein
MMDLLQTLCKALCEPDITVARASKLIGNPRPRAGALAPLVIEPAAAGVTHAEIVGDSDSAPPAYVRLTLTPNALTLDDLQAAFGEGNRVPRSRPGQGARSTFYARPAGKAHTCALIAETADDGAVQTLTLRRDQAL